MCFFLHQSTVVLRLVYQAEGGMGWGEREQPLLTASCWNWRRSSTSAPTCVALEGWRWPLGCGSPIARSRSGFRTAEWGTRKNAGMQMHQVHPSGLCATLPPSPVQTTWRIQERVLSELPPPQVCTSRIMLLCPLSLGLTVMAPLVSVFTLQTLPI